MTIRVAAGVILRDGRYLITRREAGTHLEGFWEFPGGRCEAGESLEDCLRRELYEELGVEIADPVLFQTIRHEYKERKVELHFFRCSIQKGEARPLGCSDLRWATVEELTNYEFPPADRSLIQALQHPEES
jgi:mutator protein MutT